MRYSRWLVALAAALVVTSWCEAATVAIIDSGVSPAPQLPASKILPGIDLIDNDGDPSDENGHGTRVATIVVVYAPNADIVPVRVLDANGEGTVSDIAAGVNYAADDSRIRVLNLSLGHEGGFVPIEAAALQKAARADKVIVFAAGNDGAPEPGQPAALANDLGGAALAVGAVNVNDVIQPYSNRAGSVQDFYLVAYDGNGGTSFAAPVVSAGAALLIAYAPHLTAQQVVQILVDTAVDLGAPGPDPIYGMGKVDLQAALDPQGPLGLYTGDTVSDSGGGGGGSGAAVAFVAVGAAAAFALLHRSRTIESAMVLDSYGRPYYVDLGDLVEVKGYVPRLSSLFESFGAEVGHTQIRTAQGVRLDIQYLEPKAPRYDPIALVNPSRNAVERELDMVVALDGETGQGLQWALGLNADPAAGFGALGLGGGAPAGFMSERALSAPYLGFGERADTLRLGYRTSRRSAVTLGVVQTDVDGPLGQDSDAAVVEGRYDVSDRASVKLQLGHLNERGSFFGGSPGGAFAVDEARTVAAGVSGGLRLGSRFTLIGNYSEGITRVDDTRNSVVHDFSTLRSNAYGVGLLGERVLRDDDRLGVALSRPLRVTAGSVSVDVPVERDIDGNIFKSHERVDLDALGTETDLELFYQSRVGKHTNIGAYLLYQHQPYHNPELGDQATVFGVISRAF